MSAHSDGDTPTPGETHILDTLENTLAEQIDAARKADMDRVETLSGRCDELLATARQAVEGETGSPPANQAETPPAGERIDITRLWHLAAMHDRIRLTLAAHRTEAGEQLKRMTSGRKIVRTYGAGQQ